MGPRSGFVFSLNIKRVCVLSRFSHEHSSHVLVHGRAGRRLCQITSEKGASTASRGLPWREGPGGAVPWLPPQIQGVKRQNQQPRSPARVSEVTKTHRKTSV